MLAFVAGLGRTTFCLSSVSELKATSDVLDAGAMENLAPMVHLRFLNLNCCALLSDTGLGQLKNMRELHTLHLTWCPLLTDASLDELAALPNLQVFHLEFCTGMTAEGISRLKQAKPKLLVIEDRLSERLPLDVFDGIEWACKSSEWS